MIRRPPRSTQSRSSAASDVYKRQVVPALMNDFVSMQKDVGLISILGAVDAVRAAQIHVAQSYNFTPYVIAALLFVAMSWPMIRLTDWLTARLAKREQIGG